MTKTEIMTILEMVSLDRRKLKLPNPNTTTPMVLIHKEKGFELII